MGSFVWSHSSISDLSSAAGVAISQDASGVFSVLTISSVLISHARTYSCEVSAAGQSSAKSSYLRVQCEFTKENRTFILFVVAIGFGGLQMDQDNLISSLQSQ